MDNSFKAGVWKSSAPAEEPSISSNCQVTLAPGGGAVVIDGNFTAWLHVWSSSGIPAGSSTMHGASTAEAVPVGLLAYLGLLLEAAEDDLVHASVPFLPL